MRTYTPEQIERKRAYIRSWRKQNPDKVRAFNKTYHKRYPLKRQAIRKQSAKRHANSRYAYHLSRTYGIDKVQYDAMFESQQGLCALCGRHQREFKSRLAVDHDHATTTVRALLCGTCNLGIGNLQDRPDLLRKAAAYVESHRARNPVG